jgi:predicted acetylornithine/succinylornithine family transaminase
LLKLRPGALEGSLNVRSTPTPAVSTDQLIARAQQVLSPNYARQPIAIVRGEGVWLYDADEGAYLDLFAGFGAGLLGHAHPELVEAVTEQAGRLWHVGNLLHTEPQVRLAEAIAETGFGGQSFFCHSGADANEAAVKLARLYGRQNPGPSGPRYKVISASQSFHGRSFAMMAATGQGKVGEGFAPLPEGFDHVPYNDPAALEQAIDSETVAVLLEPIQGEGGVVIPDADYLQQVRKLCDRRDLLLILDEVWTGGGRTGRMFAHQHFGVTPDAMTLAKGVGGGLPVGVMCAKPSLTHLVDASQRGVKHATTLGGNAIAMAASAKLFEVIQRDGLADHAATLGEHALQRLNQWVDQYEAVAAVRGRGLFIGIELNPASDHAWFDTARDVFTAALKQGLLVNATQGNVLRLAPPLTITQKQLDDGLDRLERVLCG